MKTLKSIGAFLWICLFLLNGSLFAADKGNFSIQPNLNNGQKWRIGYYEGGPYSAYQQNLIALLNGLMELGWIGSTEIPHQEGEQTQELWKWLGTVSKSSYIEFVQDAHYSAEWDEKDQPVMTAAIIERLNIKQDIDLMIVAGTSAGKAMANDQHHVPCVIISTSDPLSAGIIKSIEDSGYDHVHARVDPTRYERQIQIFHDIIGFQKLGVAYDNSAIGISGGSIDKVEKVAKEGGFEVISCYTKDNIPDVKISEDSVKHCFEELVKQVDAIYVTLQNGVNPQSIPSLVNIANTAKIPTFSQEGSQEVQWGFLLSISHASYKYVGQFYAETIAKIFNGAKPRQLNQLFEDPPKIAINLKTAETIGYDPSVDVLGAADEIYQEILTPGQ